MFSTNTAFLANMYSSRETDILNQTESKRDMFKAHNLIEAVGYLKSAFSICCNLDRDILNIFKTWDKAQKME